MNLWAKRTLLLLVAALLLSCDEESFLLGFRNQNEKFKGQYIEINLGAGEHELVSIDSILSDNFSGTQRLLIGEYNDPILGQVRTESYAEIIPASLAKLATGAVYDSVVLQLRLDFYTYGLSSGQITESFTVHRIIGDTLTYRKDVEVTDPQTGLPRIVSLFGGNRYYSNSTKEYNEFENLGEVTYNVDYSRIKTNLDRTTGFDTLLAKVRLDDTFGQELFQFAVADLSGSSSDIPKFRNQVRGFAFIPNTSQAVIGFNPSAASLSKVILYYHTEENGVNKDTLTRDFNFSGVSFNNFEVNRNANYPQPEPYYVGVTPGDGSLGAQNGRPFITKLDINQFYTQFADTLTAPVIINSAELLVEPINKTEGFDLISSFDLRIMKEDDSFVDFRIPEDSINMLRYPFANTNGRDYLVLGETSQAATFSFSNSRSKVSTFLTLFLQDLMEKRELENRLRYIGLLPVNPTIGKSVNRTIFNRNNLKLRIYYTRPLN